ncbi:pyrroline-5-carboxylate reductase [Campylobacter majalis]|uniref:pyrroline-5-carboxylate reductase n=1 Tax=Campylobacter majalis TaxID=2790656 RepID=UPI003D69A937
MSIAIGFIGGGNIAQAMMSALKNEYEIYAYARSKNDEIAKKFKVKILPNEIEVVKNCDLVFLAIKPKDYESVLQKISDTNKTIALLAPNFTISKAKEIANNAKIIRIMPNTAITIQKGVSAVAFDESFSKNDKEKIVKILNNTGEIYEIDESLFATFTGIAGSLPAYVFVFIEALADAGVLNGISRDLAYEIVSNAVTGSASLVAKTKQHPAILKDAVCSPNGTTIQALRVLESKNFRSSIIEAVNACIQKAKS